MTIWLAGGGTGGHLYPLVALAEMLAEEGQTLRLVGLADRIDRQLLAASSLPVVYQKLSRPGRSLQRLLLFAGQLIMTLVGWLIRLRQGDRVVSSGGYGSLPILLAATLKRLPVTLYEPNAVDGKTVRILARIATPQIVRPLLDQTPPLIRRALFPGAVDGRARLLVLGGSQGSRSLNHLLLEIWEKILDSGRFAGIDWITGDTGFAEVSEATAKHKSVQVRPFCSTMQNLYQNATGAIARAGAGSVLELALWRIPAVYVPLPWAADDHQRRNAGQAQQRGWGIVCEESAGAAPLLSAIGEIGQRGWVAAPGYSWEISRQFWLDKVAA